MEIRGGQVISSGKRIRVLSTYGALASVFNLLPSGLYRRLRNFTGSCAISIFENSLAGFTAGRELATRNVYNWALSPCPEGCFACEIQSHRLGIFYLFEL